MRGDAWRVLLLLCGRALAAGGRRGSNGSNAVPQAAAVVGITCIRNVAEVYRNSCRTSGYQKVDETADTP